ncbi:MAG TPA: hypothetical protein VG406_19655 [Isosphaeraceae bacterium]|jgi:hypothetical protein|nr:hypothetical protein [Isosphaeraceae bacterium]
MSRTTKGGRGRAARAALAAVVVLMAAGRAHAQLGADYITPFSAMGPGYYGSPFANFSPGYFGAFGFAGPGYFAGSPFANPNVTAIPYTTMGFGLPYMGYGYGYGFGPGYGYGLGPFNGGYGYGYGAMSATNVDLANARAAQAYGSAALTEQQAVGTMLNNYRMLQAMSPFQTYINTATAMPTRAHYQRQRQAPARAPMPREKVIGDDGKVLWPKGTPRDADLDAQREAAEKAVAVVARQHRVDGQATVADTIDAERKVSTFGRAALAKLRESNAPNVADFEHFLRSLDHNVQGLADAAPAPAANGNGRPTPPPTGDTRPANNPKTAGDVLRDTVKDQGKP